jgi:hypothetical protein
MAHLKSQTEEFLLGLVSNVFIDLVQKYPQLGHSLARDLETIVSRTAAEGVSFLTKTLPKLGKAIDQALENQKLNRPREFKPYGRKEIPAFMSGILSLVFSDDGDLLDDFPILVLRDIRQVCFVVYKTAIPYSKVSEQRVLETFVENERLLDSLVLDIDQPLLVKARAIVCDIFRDFDPKDVKPRHGPGAVATGERGNEKWTFKRLYSSIHSYYPYYEYFMVGGVRSLLDGVRQYRALERCTEGTAKVVLVPKDSRGPRLISCEPLEFQFIQQGLGRAVMNHLERHPITRGHVNFADQSINADLALTSSITREFATLDMKDASDLVSLDLVRALFPTELMRALEATRSASTRLPDGRVVRMKKFAPMGSALCFPIEAVCFYALSVAAMQIAQFRDAQRKCYVYGDDIVVPTIVSTYVMDCLESVGLKVNRSKSFVKGFFRESCGTDAYRGVNVTPFRNKVPFVDGAQNANVAASIVAFANHMTRNDFPVTAAFLRKTYTLHFGKLPYGTVRAGYPCIQVPSAFMAIAYNVRDGWRCRWNPKLHRVEIMTRVLRSRAVSQPLDGWERLLSGLLARIDRDPLLVVLPHNTQITSGWRAVQ